MHVAPFVLRDVYLAIDDLRADKAEEAFDRLTAKAKQLRDKGFDGSAAAAEKLARTRYNEAVDLTKPPRVVLSDGSGSTYDIPEIDTLQIARWLDTSASLAATSEIDLVDARRVVTAMNMSLLADDAKERADAAKEIGAALRLGLEQRIGEHLSDVERGLYLTLRSLSGEGKRPRVCETCWIVFHGRTASTCRTCGRNRSRSTPQPWHLEAIPGDRRTVITTRSSVTNNTVARSSWIRRAGTPVQTSYRVACTVCEAEFTAVDARARFCPSHATGAARVSRVRARKAPPKTPKTF